MLMSIKTDSPYQEKEKVIMKLGVHSLARFNRDNTDRNRTSPFAFTGNKFEFRSLGSSDSIACCNIMLNAAVAESLKQYADRLEKAEDFQSELLDLIKETVIKHERILFNGNGYGEEWVDEAVNKRGLLNLRTTADAMPYLIKEKNKKMLIEHKVFTETELNARCEIMLENYCKVVNIEGHTMVDMVKKNYLPAIRKYTGDIAQSTALLKGISSKITCAYEISTAERLCELSEHIMESTQVLERALKTLPEAKDCFEASEKVRDEVLPAMETLRKHVDEAEVLTDEEYWPFPSYGKLLFSVH